MRIASLTCSNTEIVCALGLADQLVAIDDHSDHPESVCRRVERVGPDLTIDVEALAGTEPDIVLASLTVPGHEKVVEQLQHPVHLPQHC
ncbi:MAG: ABC transporter substrate-binding protein [Planctomycetes bacterium]|nr:ABC transporter substrate-binding protein [Planctomycetota bacterium]